MPYAIGCERVVRLASRFGGGGDGGRPDMAATAPAQMLPDEEGVELWELFGLSMGSYNVQQPLFTMACCASPGRLQEVLQKA